MYILISCRLSINWKHRTKSKNDNDNNVETTLLIKLQIKAHHGILLEFLTETNGFHV